MDNTFTTPVFNGSTSLRDAAGQLIENAAKGARRKQVVDDAFVQTQLEDVTSLYRLDQILSGPEGPADLGPLPTASVALLVSLALIWGIMGAYILVKYVKKRRKSGEYIS